MRAPLRLAACSLLLPALGCGGFRTQTTRRAVTIEAEPAGATISRIDARGRRSLGAAPQTVEVPVKEMYHEASAASWVLGGLISAAAVGLLAGWQASDADDPANPAGLRSGGKSTGLFVAGLTTAIVGLSTLGIAAGQQASDGDLFAWTFEDGTPTFEATHPGFDSARITLKEGHAFPEAPLHLALKRVRTPGDVALGGVLLGTAAPGAGGLGIRTPDEPAPVDARPVIAVPPLQDRARLLKGSLVAQLTDYLPARVAELGRFRVVPEAQLAEELRRDKGRSYGECFDERCQLELGKALAASKVLSTKVSRVAGECALSVTLFDLVSETSETAATVRTACDERALVDGLDQLVQRLGAR
jgi:hypothetical protein